MSPNVLAVLALLLQDGPQFEALFAAIIAAWKGVPPQSALQMIRSHKTALATGDVVTNPTSVDDILTTDDAFAELQDYMITNGFTDAALVALVASEKATNLQNGATAVLAYQAANPGAGGPVLFTHNSLDYGVDTAATPPVIVQVAFVAPSAIPYSAPTPAPAP